ncbi:MAG: hypothetical protein ACP5QS_01310, partial [bacterium]
VQILKVNNFSGTLTIWLALDVGIVKSEFKYQGSADFKDTKSGKTGTATFSSSQVEELESYSVK